MPRKPIIGTCTGCGQEKPLFDVKNKLCGSCAGKKGGRKPKALEKPPAGDPKAPLSSASVPGVTHSPADTNPRKSRLERGSGENSAVSASSGETYLCDACRKPVRYAQQVCKCGTWCDWRNTPVVDDPAYLVCLECGAVAGLSSNPPAVCPHCNSSG